MSNYNGTHHFDHFSVKPEQLEALQEKVKTMVAEGRRLDGSKPALSWQELRLKNHELQKQVEEAEDVIFDYRRRSEEWRVEANNLRNKILETKVKLLDATKANEKTEADLRKARDTVRGLCEIIAHLVPEFGEELKKTTGPAEREMSDEERMAEARRARNRQYYAKNKDKFREWNHKYYVAHKERLAEDRRRRGEAKKNASK